MALMPYRGVVGVDGFGFVQFVGLYAPGQSAVGCKLMTKTVFIGDPPTNPVIILYRQFSYSWQAKLSNPEPKP